MSGTQQEGTAAMDDVLTEEERQALAHLDADSDEAAAASDAGAAEQKPDNAAPAGQQQDQTTQEQPDAQKSAAPAAQAEAAAEQTGTDEEKPQAAAPAFPRFDAPKDAQAQLSELSKRMDDLDTDFDNGELTAAEFRAQTRALQDQERTLREQMLMANMSEQARKQTYQTSVQSFLSSHAEYQEGSQMFSLLDAELRRIQTAAPGKGIDPLDPSLIHQAHASLQALFGKSTGAPVSPTTPAAQQQTQQQVPQRELPPAFHSVPATATQDIGDPVVNGLSRLDGEEFEAAFARLPEATREQFLARMN